MKDEDSDYNHEMKDEDSIEGEESMDKDCFWRLMNNDDGMYAWFLIILSTYYFKFSYFVLRVKNTNLYDLVMVFYIYFLFSNDLS